MHTFVLIWAHSRYFPCASICLHKLNWLSKKTVYSPKRCMYFILKLSINTASLLKETWYECLFYSIKKWIELFFYSWLQLLIFTLIVPIITQELRQVNVYIYEFIIKQVRNRGSFFLIVWGDQIRSGVPVDSFGKFYMKIVLLICIYFSVILRIKLKTIMIEKYRTILYKFKL